LKSSSLLAYFIFLSLSISFAFWDCLGRGFDLDCSGPINITVYFVGLVVAGVVVVVVVIVTVILTVE